ncbi:MAG TPA: DUF3891 family protein [Azospirillum sp.]|nr:DUF3891 family protein [Azospirillum sp.]
MLFRDDGDGVIAIAQPSHSWLSGQLLRAWGNDGFAAPSPHEEVCLAAELHDIGWLVWETAPTLNPATGRPHAFHEVGAETHTGLWTRGVRLARVFGHYPALLVSLHADTLYGLFFDFTKASPEDAARVRAFLATQHSFQRQTIEALGADPHYRVEVAPDVIERNRRLVATVDRLSLEICWGVTREIRIPNVPTTGTECAGLCLRAPNGNVAELTLDPWPFAGDHVEVVCEGRRLRGRFTEEAAMRDALDGAERITIAAALRPEL